MVLSKLKYLFALTAPVLVYFSLNQEGWLSFSAFLFGFVFLPVLELLLPLTPKNLTEIEKGFAKKDRFYDLLLYLFVPLQFYLLWLFLNRVSEPGIDTVSVVGSIFSMGFACGVLGINLGHELGHRRTWYEQGMAKLLLMTSLYMQFYIDHNRGHHVDVGTKGDASTAKYNQNVYAFLIQSIFGSLRSAWCLEKTRLQRRGFSPWSFKNQTLRFAIYQLSFVAMIYFLWGWVPMLCFLAAATHGFILLELVNYIEHYGLARKKLENGKYESTQVTHSWNSNHPIGRIFLFELTRHSDHHTSPLKKYQLLNSVEGAPQLPFGYPTSIVISLLPPLWFRIMNPLCSKFFSIKTD